MRLNRSAFLYVAVALLLSLPAGAQVAADYAGIASDCLTNGPRTAVGRLPAARLVVFDPVTNSFAFVACPGADQDPNSIANRDYLDRRRLTLDVQKIRLLILPYNPMDGDLLLRVERGAGKPEIQSIVLGGEPPQKPPAAPKAEAKDKLAKEEAKKEPAPSAAKTRLERALPELQGQVSPRLTARISDLDRSIEKTDGLPAKTQQVWEFSQEAIPESNDPKKQARDEVAQKLAAARRLSRLHEEATERGRLELADLKAIKSCIDDRLDGIPRNVTASFAQDSPLRTGRDVFLQEVFATADTRRQVLASAIDSYDPCRGEDFYDELSMLGRDISKCSGHTEEGVALISHFREILADLRQTGMPPGTKPGDWGDLLADLDTRIGELAEEQGKIFDLIAGLRDDIDLLRNHHRKIREELSSPAAYLQRFNFPPIANGEVLSFIFARGEKAKMLDGLPDGKLSNEPGLTNSLELRSAPTFTAQLGMGIVYSGLKNPTFKGVDGKIALASEGQKGVLPALFIHHHWARRSPLLRPTGFEMFAPTFSLAIPLANADPLQEALLGLNWELSPGIDLNAGLHFGKVNALTGGLAEDDKVPTGADVSNLQKTRFDKSYYFGIVLNRDIFDRFRQRSTDEK